MGCVQNVYDKVNYDLSCLSYVIRELRQYRLKKKDREVVSASLHNLYQVAIKYRENVSYPSLSHSEM